MVSHRERDGATLAGIVVAACLAMGGCGAEPAETPKSDVEVGPRASEAADDLAPPKAANPGRRITPRAAR
jgi:hypothetical protein